MRRLIVVMTIAVLSAVGVAPVGASAPEANKARPVKVAQLNLLHGLFCMPEQTDYCNAPARVEIFGKWLERSKCPELVGLQEINPRLTELLADLLETACDGKYEMVADPTNDIDTQMVLTTLEIEEQGLLDIANFPWEAAWVQVKSPQGPIDFITAHFASSSNNPPCTAENCPVVCAAGITTNECHAHEIVEFLGSRRGAAVSILAGDLNAEQGSPTLAAFTNADYVDSWLDVGRKECDPETGKGCTGCSEAPTTYIGMETTAGLDCDARIDFVLAKEGEDCKLNITSAKGFAHKPLPTAIDGLYWPSDHHGTQAAFRCK